MAESGYDLDGRASGTTESYEYEDDDKRVPVTILTGFLGSGKTTLFNHILTAMHGKKIAVIQNEFGDVGIDDKLMAKNTKFQSDEELTEVLNGCVCCSVRTDLVRILKRLAARQQAGTLKLDAIVIETTGMADPAPVAQTFLVETELRDFARMDGVVTLVDAKHIEQHLDEKKADGTINEAVQQVAFADRLLLNKVDLVPSETALARVEARLRSINAFAPIRRCTRSHVSVDTVLSIDGFDLQRTLTRDPSFMAVTKQTKHDKVVGSHSIDQGAPRHLRGIIKKGALDLGLVQEWISGLLDEHGADIYRMKGVLAVAHAEQRFVFHAVHMLWEGAFEAPWADDEARESKLVFIGRNLDAAALNASFNACLDTAALRAERLAALRFKVGDTVECNTDDAGWVVGEVVNLIYRDESMPPGEVAPFYQVRLREDGEYVDVPADDALVRPPRRRSARLLHETGVSADDDASEEAADVRRHAVGARVAVWWAVPGAWYYGVVREVAHSSALMAYDDGDVAWHGMHELRDETEVASDEGDAHGGYEHAHDDKRARGERTTRSAAKRPRKSSHSHAHDDADGHGDTSTTGTASTRTTR